MEPSRIQKRLLRDSVLNPIHILIPVDIIFIFNSVRSATAEHLIISLGSSGTPERIVLKSGVKFMLLEATPNS